MASLFPRLLCGHRMKLGGLGTRLDNGHEIAGKSGAVVTVYCFLFFL